VGGDGTAAKGAQAGNERGGRRHRPAGSGCRGVPANFAGERRSRSRGAARGGVLGKKWPRGLRVAGEEAGRLRVRPIKNRKNFEIRLRIFQTTQNRKISKNNYLEAFEKYEIFTGGRLGNF
jgi:hypothetical protein